MSPAIVPILPVSFPALAEAESVVRSNDLSG